MVTNKKSILFVFITLVLLLGVSTVNAVDINDTTAIPDKTQDVVDIQKTITDSKVIKTDNTPKKTYKNKNVKKATTHNVTNSTVSQYFIKDKNYTLADNISEGDTLDIQGKITGLDDKNFSMIINKPINIISSTHDGYIDLNTTAGSYFGDDPGTTFAITTGADFTNVTGITLHNTQLWISAVNNVTVNNISAIVEDRRVGSGVGQTTIRNGAENITIKNSLISTTNNGGSSSVVLAWANHCLIENCTILGEGNVGNLFYITTFNVEIPQGTVSNSFNTLKNCYIRGPTTASAISVAVVLSGSNNKIVNNTIDNQGSGIGIQFGAGAFSNYTIANNTLLGNAGIAGFYNSIIENNTIAASLTVINSTARNNTVQGGLTITNSTARNNTVKGSTTINGKSDLTENTLTSVTMTAVGASNSTIINNTITGLISIQKQATNITVEDNIIKTTQPYALSVTTTGNIIKNNYITARAKASEDAVNIVDGNTFENNTPTGATYNITDDTYTNFFGSDGKQLDNITNFTKLNFIGEFNNKNFTFDNVIVTINGINAILNDATITTKNSALIDMSNITINTKNTNAIVLNSNSNFIQDVNITHNGSTSILINSKSNSLSKIIININSTTNNTSVISITKSNNTITQNNIIANGNITAINITSSEEPITNIVLSQNNITIIGDNVNGIMLNGNISMTSPKQNNIKLVATENANGIILNGNSHDNTIESNNINITANADANGIIIANATNKGYKQIIQSNNINITSRNAIGINAQLNFAYAMGTISKNCILINSTDKVVAINYVGDNLTAQSNTINVTSKSNNPENAAITLKGNNLQIKGYTINAINASAVIIKDSNNTILNSSNCRSNSTNPIELINTQNSTIYSISANTESNSVINLINSSNNIITKNTIIANIIYGGNKVVKTDANSKNNTIEENLPLIYILTNETYKDLFDENGDLKVNCTDLYLQSDLYGVIIGLNQRVNLVNMGNYTLYNTTLRFTGNYGSITESNLNIQNINKTAIISNLTSSNEITITYSNINVTGDVPVFILAMANDSQKRSTLCFKNTNITLTGNNVIMANITGLGANANKQPIFNVMSSNINITANKSARFIEAYYGCEKISSNNITINAPNIQAITNNQSNVYALDKNNIILNGVNVTLLNETNTTASKTLMNNKINITANKTTPFYVVDSKYGYSFLYNTININVTETLNGHQPAFYTPDSTVKSNTIRITDAQGNQILGNEAVIAKTVSSNTPKDKYHTFIDIISNIKYNQPGNITITLVDLYGNPIENTPFNVTIDGQTYTIENATANITLIPKSRNITATVNYTGNENSTYQDLYEEVPLNIIKGDSNITIYINSDIRAGETLNLVAVIEDNGQLVKDGFVVFKLNGVTLKDAEGNRIKVRVVNGVAQLNYTIPAEYSAKDYILTCVFASEDYARVDTNQTITIMKKEIHLQPTQITYVNNSLTIKGDILDSLKAIKVHDNIKFTLKINGKTQINRAISTNGTLDIDYKIALRQGNHNITICLGENNHYKGYNMTILINNPITPTPIINTENNTTIKVEE